MTLEQVAVQAALRAAEVLSRRPKRIDRKGAVDLVTELDLASEEVIREVLSQHTPDIPIHGEERGGAPQAHTRWVVDPLDGTTNFVHGFPYYCTSIGLEVEGQPTVGVITDPTRGDIYRATLGQGAFLNDQPMKVSDTRTLHEALVATGFGYDRRERPEFYLSRFRAVMTRAQGMRRAGAAALDLAQLASGRVDAFWEFNLQRWDVAAGVVLIREAGGVVTSLLTGRADLSERPCPLASNPWLHEELGAVLAASQDLAGRS